MKLAVTIILLPAVLALPSYNGHGHGHLHSHGSKPYHSGIPSGGPFQAGSTGPYGLSNTSAISQAGTSVGGANTVTQTSLLTLYNTLYNPSATPSEAADTGSGGSAGAGGACGGTTTVTYANTVTVTVTGGGAESATAVTPKSETPVTPNQAPETQAPVTPVASSTAPVAKPVASISASSVPAVEHVATPSSTAVSSTATPENREAATSALSATPSSSATAAAGSQGKTSPKPPGSKRGLFIPVSQDATQNDYVLAFNANPGKISWIVNQFSGPPGNLSSEFQFVPQCYDKFSDVSKPHEAPHPWTTNAERALATGTENFFLSFGEPNTPNDQGFTMDAQEGANTFMTMMQPWATEHGVTIGSPGTLGGPQDVQWQNDFLDNCAKLGCKIGWVSAHWFSPCGPATAQELADTFWGTINTYKGIAQKHSAQYGIDLKVWVDNFSLNCKSETQQEFLDIVVPQMDADPMIDRYGYVSRTDINQGDGFMNSDGTMSDLGRHYATM